MVVVYIKYTGDESTRFDRSYYRNHHLPLVMQYWKRHGLESLSVLYPEDLGIGTQGEPVVLTLPLRTLTEPGCTDPQAFQSGRQP